MVALVELRKAWSGPSLVAYRPGRHFDPPSTPVSVGRGEAASEGAGELQDARGVLSRLRPRIGRLARAYPGALTGNPHPAETPKTGKARFDKLAIPNSGFGIRILGGHLPGMVPGLDSSRAFECPLETSEALGPLQCEAVLPLFKTEAYMSFRRRTFLSLNLMFGGLFLGLSQPVQAWDPECDTGPECQCECLEAWDECAQGLPTPEARELCDPAYEACWEENCEPE